MKKIICIIATLFAITISTNSYAQKERTRGIIWSYLHGLEYELKAGVNIGGTAPLPLPSEIRKINSYSPNLALSFGTEITKWFSDPPERPDTSGYRKTPVPQVEDFYREFVEMGADAVLVNTAIAAARDPIRMARAFKTAVESAREAVEAGLPSQLDHAEATSPLAAFLKSTQA